MTTEQRILAAIVRPLGPWKQAGGDIKEGEGFSVWPPLKHTPITTYRTHNGWWLSVDCKTYPTLEAAQAAAWEHYLSTLAAALDLGKMVALLRALKLAEHDQIDLLGQCQQYAIETTDFRKKEMRMLRANAISGRLMTTRAALAELGAAP